VRTTSNVPAPRLSFILATDTGQTVSRVIDSLRQQTVRDAIEVVLIAPSTDAVRNVLAHRDEFAGMPVVENPVTDLAQARAAGVRAATAPIIFIGETHSYPHPELAEMLLKAFHGPWAVAIPAFQNANPSGPLSWANFFSDYGYWAEGRAAGEIAEVPLHDAAIRRSVLLELGDRLPLALGFGDEIYLAIRSGGHRTYYEPAARIEHAHITQPTAWLFERFLLGLLTASYRAQRWSVSRRLAYVAGSPLIPLVLFRRMLPAIRRMRRQAGQSSG
jgi:Glycosyl transferase family 2